MFMSHVPEQSTPFIGDRFPDITVQTTMGKMSLPNVFKGHWFILFSHPADFTPVCTTEFVAFASLKNEFDKLNTQIIGLSVDQVFSHIKWTEWIRQRLGVQITFPIIADGIGTAAKRLGLIHPTKGTRTIRSVFIVDPEGTIRVILTYPETVGRNIHEIMRTLQALQLADANQVAIPANWPNNEVIGDKVIIPPARTIQEVAERKAEAKAGHLDCFDWWFCTK
jgi:peroxiredoxin (alkyl hydroperoxide reductase subunit C)